jgi:hypothetical protein
MRLVPAFAFALVATAAPVAAQRLDQAAALQDAQRVALAAPQPSASAAAPASRFSLDRLFSPEHFRMSHSVEFTSGAMGAGAGFSLGVYTNTMQWQVDDKLAARLDLAVATFPTGVAPRGFGVAPSQGVQAYVRNAEIAYRPTRSSEIRLQFQQNPYGQGAYGYAPYGQGVYGYQPYGYVPANRSSRFTATLGSGSDDLFWRGR